MSEVKREIFGMSVKIGDAGEFKNDSGEVVKYPEGIKIISGKGWVKLSALQMASILLLKDDEEFRAELMTRVTKEKAQIALIDLLN